MSGEVVIAGGLFKWVMGLVSFVFGGLFAWLFKKMENTYTKEQTEHLIDLKTRPMIESIERLIESNKEVAEATKKNNTSVQELTTTVRVLEERMRHVGKGD